MVDKDREKKDFADRATKARDDKGMSNYAIAKHFEISAAAVGKWFNQGTISKDRIKDLADLLDVSYLWLATGEMVNLSPSTINGASNVYAIEQGEDTPKDVVMIDSYRVTYSMGDGVVETTLVEEGDPVPFKLSYFQKKNINPKTCKRFTAEGDSMSPTIWDKDSVLVDMSQNTIIDGKVYALRYGDVLKVKRLYKQLNGGIIIRSDNPDIPDEQVSVDDCNTLIEIHGRVIDRSGDSGL